MQRRHPPSMEPVEFEGEVSTWPPNCSYGWIRGEHPGHEWVCVHEGHVIAPNRERLLQGTLVHYRVLYSSYRHRPQATNVAVRSPSAPSPQRPSTSSASNARPSPIIPSATRPSPISPCTTRSSPTSAPGWEWANAGKGARGGSAGWGVRSSSDYRRPHPASSTPSNSKPVSMLSFPPPPRKLVSQPTVKKTIRKTSTIF